MAALKLKLKVGGSQSPVEGNSSGNDQSNGGNKQHKSKPGSSKEGPKLKIKPPKPDKVTKPVPKDKVKKLKLSIGGNKPRQLENVNIEGTSQPVKRVPKVRVKPSRVPGDGYDSETPDLEDDPLVESGIMIRFLDDMNLDFVQNAVESNDLSGINIKWLTKDKALINIKGTIYSGRLVDLPTVSEMFKTVDKKNIFKVLDLCQMLLVIKTVNPNDMNLDTDFSVPKESVYKHPLYDMSVDSEIKPYRQVMKNGLVYPFEDVYRRFKPRKINHRIMDDIEARVNELIQLDNEAEESHFEIIDPTKEQQRQHLGRNYSPSPSPQPFATPSVPQQQDMGEGMEGEDDDGVEDEDEDEDEDDEEGEGGDLEQELAKALETNAGLVNGDEDIEEVILEGDTPGVPGGDEDDDEEGEEIEVDEGEDDEDEDDDDEDDDDEDDDEDDDDDDDDDGSKAGKQHVRMLEEEIGDLVKAVEFHRKGLESATHKMMKMKFQNSYNTLKASLDSKKRELSKLSGDKDSGERKERSQLNREEDDDDDEEEDDDDEEEEEEEDDDDEEEEDDDEEGEENEENQNVQQQDENNKSKDDRDNDIDDLF